MFIMIHCVNHSVSRCCVVSHSDVSLLHVRLQKHSDEKKTVRERLQNREARSGPQAVCVSLCLIFIILFTQCDVTKLLLRYYTVM